MRCRLVMVFACGALVAQSWISEPLRSQSLTGAVVDSVLPVISALDVQLMKLLVQPVFDETENPPGKFNVVKPQEFDPGNTHLVQAAWLQGIGCPTNARTATPNATFTGIAGFGTYTDPACPVGDPDDLRNEGLLLAKTGPTTTNFASAAAELINVKGIIVSELGYDIRKAGGHMSPLGSHCGGGAPRFIVLTATGGFIIGCNSVPQPIEGPPGSGWTRLRWQVPATPVERIVILFDEGQDPSGGPDFFGAAILDNITVNGKMVGRGAVDAN